MSNNKTLWGVQVVFGLYFIFVGISHFIVPDGLPGPMEWMYELSDGLHIASGTAEILGGLGLILPGLTKIRTELTHWAAFGLAAVMIGAAIWHAGRGEPSNIFLNVVIAAIMGYVGYARMKVTPLTASTG
jgi:uncharacterized membrane protein